jgi:hypothetical protein
MPAPERAIMMPMIDDVVLLVALLRRDHASRSRR